MSVIAGNVVALFASLLMVGSSYVKDKVKSLWVSTIQLVFNVIAGILLGAYTAVVVNVIGIPRNILAAKDRLTRVSKVCLIVVSTVCAIAFNQHGVLGFLPVINTAIYILLLDYAKGAWFKWLTIFCLVLWAVYDCITLNFVSMSFDIASVVAAVVAVVRILRDKNKGGDEQVA